MIVAVRTPRTYTYCNQQPRKSGTRNQHTGPGLTSQMANTFSLVVLLLRKLLAYCHGLMRSEQVSRIDCSLVV